MIYKKIYESRKPGLRPVSVWIKSDPKRSFDEVIVGQEIKEDNIKYKRFNFPVAICQNAKELRNALKKFNIYNNIMKSKSAGRQLMEYVSFFKK